MIQYLIDGLATACAILPVAIGFLLIYRTLGVLHFAHGAMVALGACLLVALKTSAGVPTPLAMAIAVLATGGAGWLSEAGLYRPLRARNANTLAAFIASLGLYTLAVSTLALVFGDGTRSIDVWTAAESVAVPGARISLARLTAMAGGAVAVFAVWVVLHRTNAGRQFEAVASDPELAAAVGVDVPAVYSRAMIAGSMLAGLAGCLVSLDVGASPTMGILPLLSAVVAVFVGGGTVAGVTAGAFVIGLAQHFGVLWLAVKWQSAILYLILVLFLLARPRGIAGIPAREGAS